jgi:hypothetical protein
VTETRHEWDVITATTTTDGGVGVIWRRYGDGLLVVARKDETPEQALARHMLRDNQIN